MKNNNSIQHTVSEYYSEKINTHGPSPKGVDWNGEKSQLVRFEQLIKILPPQCEGRFSVNDLGCGYAAIVDFLTVNYKNFSYLGLDISQDMISAAAERTAEHANVRLKCSSVIDEVADFGLASGVFNVKLEHSDSDWLAYIKSTLQNLNQTSSKGFAFNCLTSYSDQDKMRPYLYYANPTEIFELCKRQFSKNVALLHDYELYEFTILVRKK